MEKSWMLVDEKVIQDAINKEENAINLIYEQTINSAYFVAQTHACNISYINDILQDSYIRVFEHLDTLHDYTKLQSWINAIVRNKALDYNRKCKEWTFSDLISDGDEEWDTEDENGKFIPEKEVDYVETRKIMMQIISALPSDQRICVYMRYYDQLSVNEIAQELQCNSETVKSRTRYAKKKLKESVLELEKQGTKLYAIPIIPCLCWIFQEEAKASVCPKEVAIAVNRNIRYWAHENMIASTTGKVTLAGSNMVKPIAIGLSVALVTTSLGYFGTSAFISNKLGKRESLHVAQSMNSESEGGIEQSSEEFENNDDMQYEFFADDIAWKRYSDALSNLFYANTFPDKKDTDSWHEKIDGMDPDSIEYRFSIQDIDGDGEDELMIYAYGGYMAATFDAVYKYDSSADGLNKMLGFGNEGDLYENGSIVSNDHGAQTIYYYDKEAQQYYDKGTFYLTEAVDELETYDLNGNGEICIKGDTTYCDDSEFDEIMEKYAEGAVVESFEEMPILTHETIVDVAKTASDRILERYKVIADEENDWGILLLQPYNWNFTEVRASLTKDLVANGMEYKMLDGEFGKMEDPYTYGAEYELYDKNEKIIKAEIVDGGGITFYRPIDGVSVFGSKVGDQEEKLLHNMKALGLYKVKEGVYYSGESEYNCAIEYSVDENGKISKIDLRPYCKFAE